jgi:NitT/TauT family transport system permease protein
MTAAESIAGRRGRLGRPSARSLGGLVRGYLPAVAVFIAVIAIWEIALSGPGRRVLPPPSLILNAALTNVGALRLAAQATMFEAIGGLVLGATLGLIFAFAAARWATARDLLLPIAIASSAIPIIAIAPILNNWFGVLNPFSKMSMAAILVFFPVVVNVTRGLVEVQPASLELMRSYAASEGQVLRHVRIPNMLPFFFTALKVGTTLSFIGALVGEYFGGTSDVLGRVVLQSMSSGRYSLAWTGILVGAIAAIAAYLVVSLIERIAIPWSAALSSE